MKMAAELGAAASLKYIALVSAVLVVTYVAVVNPSIIQPNSTTTKTITTSSCTSTSTATLFTLGSVVTVTSTTTLLTNCTVTTTQSDNPPLSYPLLGGLGTTKLFTAALFGNFSKFQLTDTITNSSGTYVLLQTFTVIGHPVNKTNGVQLTKVSLANGAPSSSKTYTAIFYFNSLTGLPTLVTLTTPYNQFLPSGNYSMNSFAGGIIFFAFFFLLTTEYGQAAYLYQSTASFTAQGGSSLIAVGSFPQVRAQTYYNPSPGCLSTTTATTTSTSTCFALFSSVTVQMGHILGTPFSLPVFEILTNNGGAAPKSVLTTTILQR